MEESLNRCDRFVLDTSAFLSLEGVNLLKILCNKFALLTTSSVMRELEDFAHHQDRLGNVAKKILGLKKKITTKETTVKRDSVGEGGGRSSK